jgi:hypothetical protein
MAKTIDISRFLLNMPGFPAPGLKDYIFADINEDVAREIVSFLEGKVSISESCEILKQVQRALSSRCSFSLSDHRIEQEVSSLSSTPNECSFEARKPDLNNGQNIKDNTTLIADMSNHIVSIILGQNLSYYTAIGTLTMAEYLIKGSCLALLKRKP